MEEDLQTSLSKIRLHVSSGLAHQKTPATLLVAIESTLESHATEPKPTAYFAALMTTLEGVMQKEGTSALEEGDTLPAVLYLLSLVAPHVPHAVLRAQLSTILELVGPLFPPLQPHAPALRSLLGIIGAVLQALDASHLNVTGARGAFAALLESSLDARPKVRRRAADAVRDILSAPPTPLLVHPYTEIAATSVRNALSRADSPDAALHVIALAKPIAEFFPANSMSQLASALVTLPKHGHAYLTQASYELLAVLMHDANGVDAASILKTVLSAPPPTADTVLAPAWVRLVGRIAVAYAKAAPDDCAREVASVWATCWAFLEAPAPAVREAAKEALVNLTTCISQTLVESALADGAKAPLTKMVALASKSLDSLAFASAVPQILAVLSALLFALRYRNTDVPGVDKTPAESLMLPVVQRAGEFRTQQKFLHKEAADGLLDMAIRVMGPEVVLRALPLNLEPSDREAGRVPRAFLLALLHGPHPTPLTHFVSYFVPLSERMFDLQQRAGDTAEGKMWSVLVAQVWAGLSGYCWNPTGLRDGLNPTFSKLLAGLLHSQETLRPAILNALRTIADTTRNLADDTFSSTSVSNLAFVPSKSEAEKNLAFLRSQAGTWLATLFNVFGAADKDAKGMVGNTINSWAALADQQEIAKAYKRVLGLLMQNLGSKKPSDEALATLQAAMDLLLLLLPFLSPKDRSALLDRCLSTEIRAHSDGGVQKRAYRVLSRCVEAGAVPSVENIVTDLAAQTDGVAAAAKRDRFGLFGQLVTHLPSTSLHVITLLIPETVLGTKEPGEKARTAAFDLLIAMGRKMAQGGVVHRDRTDDMSDDSGPNKATASIDEYFTMVAAGLAGATPHMISASITAIARLVFEFKDDVSQSMLSEILTTMMVFVSSNNREIVKSALGFVKLIVHSLPVDLVKEHLPVLVPALLGWSHDHKNHFKMKVRHIFERMLRRFGWDEVYRHAEQEEGRKVLLNIKKRKERAKRRKANNADAEEESRQARKPVKTGDTFDDVLQSSGSEMDSSESEADDPQPTRKSKNRANNGYQLRDDPDDPMDLLHGATSRLTISSKNKSKKGASHFRTDENGRVIVGEAADTVDPSDALEGSAFIEAQTSADGFTRNARGQVKFNKDTKKRRREDIDNGSDTEMNGTIGTKERPAKTKRTGQERLGREFKAKRAGGDIKKQGQPDPYAYVSLGDAAKKAGRKGRSGLSILGRS